MLLLTGTAPVPIAGEEEATGVPFRFALGAVAVAEALAVPFVVGTAGGGIALFFTPAAAALAFALLACFAIEGAAALPATSYLAAVAVDALFVSCDLLEAEAASAAAASLAFFLELDRLKKPIVKMG